MRYEPYAYTEPYVRGKGPGRRSAKIETMLPGTIQHALCVTDDAPAVTARLRAVLGLPRHAAGRLAWHPDSQALIATILGPTSAGTIDVEPLPAELGGRLVPGTTTISFAVDDLDERVAACRAAGLAVTVAVDSPSGLSYAVVAAAGLEFELVATGSCCGEA